MPAQCMCPLRVKFKRTVASNLTVFQVFALKFLMRSSAVNFNLVCKSRLDHTAGYSACSVKRFDRFLKMRFFPSGMVGVRGMSLWLAYILCKTVVMLELAFCSIQKLLLFKARLQMPYLWDFYVLVYQSGHIFIFTWLSCLSRLGIHMFDKAHPS